MNWKRQSILMLGTIAFLVVMSLVVSAQDATQIPTLPDATEDSAAPGIQPPDSPITGQEPEATADPESTEAVSETITTVSSCPIGVQDAYTSTELICTGLASGEGCIGNGRVSTTFGAEVTGLSFANPNDRVRLSSIDQMTLDSSSAWTVVSGRLELKTKVGNTVAADFLLIGDVTLTDAGRAAASGAANATVIAQRGLIVRRTPANDGVVVWQLQGGEEVTVTGITADRTWIRLVIPNEFAGTGWAYAPYLEVEGGVEVLPVVTVNSEVPDLAPPEFGSMQSLELLSAVTPDECGATEPDSGMLLQSPSGTAESIRLQVNGVIIEFNGTIYVHAQAGSALNVDILEGSAMLIDENGATLGGVVNERLSAPLDENLAPSGAFTASNYNAAELENLPIRLLPRVIAFGIDPIEETTVNTGGFVTSTPIGGSSEPVVQTSTECTLTAPNEARNIRSGPSTVYEIVRSLQPNESVRAVGQAIGESGLVWFQTDTGGWLREDSVTLSDGCTSLPTVATPPPPAATATPVVTGPSLSSSQLPAFSCGAGTTPNTASFTSNGSALFVSIGGTWTVSAGTTVVFTTQGGQLRPEFGDFIQLVGEDGSVIAASGENHSLRFTFTESRSFEARFSAGNGDLVVMAASCE